MNNPDKIYNFILKFTLFMIVISLIKMVITKNPAEILSIIVMGTGYIIIKLKWENEKLLYTKPEPNTEKR